MSITNSISDVIYTKNLLLRKFNLNDIDDMLKNWIADIDVQSGYGEPVFTTKQDVENLLLNKWLQQYRWAIIHKTINENIGHVSFCLIHEVENVAEVEYCIGKQYWGQGLVPEALEGFLTYTFKNTAITKIEAFHRIENPASGRVLQKVGMRLAENVLRFKHMSKPPDGYICYAITKQQFFAL